MHEKIKRRFFKPLVLLGLLGFFLQAGAPTVNLKGRVLTYDPLTNTREPMENAFVELFLIEPGSGNWKLTAETSTNGEGYYYFNDVPGGEYYIQVEHDKNFKVTVAASKQTGKYQEIPVFNY
jgi:hypothetical protein